MYFDFNLWFFIIFKKSPKFLGISQVQTMRSIYESHDTQMDGCSYFVYRERIQILWVSHIGFPWAKRIGNPPIKTQQSFPVVKRVGPAH